MMDVVWVRTQHLLAWRCRTPLPPPSMTTRLSFGEERSDVLNHRKNENKATTPVVPVKKRRHGAQYLCIGQQTFERVATWDGDGSGGRSNLGE